MVTVEKKNDEKKQGGNPSVIDAFISALFASAGATTTSAPSSSNATTSSSASPLTNTTLESSSIGKGEIKTEESPAKTPISSLGATIDDEEYIPAVRSSTDVSTGKFESFSPPPATTARTAVKRERSLTEEVEAYNQLSKRKVAQPSATTSDNKRFDERDYQRRDHGRGLGEMGNMSPGRGSGGERRAYDHQHQRYQNQPNQRPQQQRQHYNTSAPPASSYRGKAEIVPYHLQAQRGQPATSTYILALKPVDWSTAVAESRMLIRDVPTHMDNWDILDHFAPYGEIIEVVIKNQLGFVHFADAADCQAAVRGENGNFMKNFKLRLEVCKQKPHFARGHQPATTKNVAPPKNMHYQPPAPTTHVHLIVWDHVPPNYVHYVSQTFEHASLPTQISYMVNRPASNQEQIIREKVDMGAIAVLNLEARHEQQQTVDLRVLNKGYDENIHFEAYESISLENAIALTKIGCSPSRSVSRSPPQTTTALVRNPLPPPPQQQQQQHPPLDLATIQQLDVNTLATIYDLVHVQLEAAIAAHQRSAATQQQQQQQQQQYGYSSQTPLAPYQVPALSYQPLPQPVPPHNPSPSSMTPVNARSYYHYPHYPSSPPQPLTSAAKHVPIPLSTEQLGNILSSVNNNNQ